MDSGAVRKASTVLLARDGVAGLEVFVLSRVVGMAFAGGVTAFPGGGVDPTDAAMVSAGRRSAGQWADRLGVSAPEAIAVLSAAVREVFEETGVLLATPAGPDGVRDGPDVERTRLELAEHRIGLTDVLARHELLADFDALIPWSRWITPVGEPSRYDTFFFVTPLPAGQSARLLTTEADGGQWHRPTEVIASAARKEHRLMPPTKINLADLADFDTVASLAGVDRTLSAVRPTRVSRPGEPLRLSIDGREVLVDG